MQTREKLMRMEGYYDQPLTMGKDLVRMIGLMVNSFVRPSDIKLIQHKHVEIIQNEYRYLRLTLPETKKHDRPIVTMPAAVGIYSRLLRDAKEHGYGRPNDFLFFPGIVKNREYALRQMEFLFNWVLKLSELKVGPKGQNRTIYSLRHTAITFRLLYGQGVDVLTLARNARTSVEMVERFYASTLNGEMNIGLLHSKRSQTKFRQLIPVTPSVQA
jgi:integrase